jgi:tRNA-dihydrouridine synthase
MIGRGAARAPWIFAYLRGREREAAFELAVDLAAVIERFLELIDRYQPAEFWPSRARRLYPYLLQNVRFGHSVGAHLANVRDYEEGRKRVRDFFAQRPERRHHVERR